MKFKTILNSRNFLLNSVLTSVYLSLIVNTKPSLSNTDMCPYHSINVPTSDHNLITFDLSQYLQSQDNQIQFSLAANETFNLLCTFEPDIDTISVPQSFIDRIKLTSTYVDSTLIECIYDYSDLEDTQFIISFLKIEYYDNYRKYCQFCLKINQYDKDCGNLPDDYYTRGLYILERKP